MNISTKKYLEKIRKNKKYILLGIIFTCFVFLRFHELQQRLFFRNDQLDNAWAVKEIMVDQKYPLIGMVAKGNTGFHIGPGYYYLIAPVYKFFNLNPIAAGYIAGLTSILTFFVIFYVIKKMFSFEMALIAVFIDTFSAFIINGDRNQWPVNFIVPISFIVFYLLWRISQGKSKYIIWLALIIGFSLHIHFTSVFYFLLCLLALPLFPRTKETLKYILISIPLFLIWLIPLARYEMLSSGQEANNLTKYIEENYHGIHLVRILQLKHDAFIEFYLISASKIMDFFGFILVPLFMALLYLKEKSKDNIAIIYLVAIWIAVPWLVFATYRSEITNYYFYITRPVALIVFSYLIYSIFSIKNIIAKIGVVAFLGYFAYVNVQTFFNAYKPDDINLSKQRVEYDIKNNVEIKFDRWNADSYMKFLYEYSKDKEKN